MVLLSPNLMPSSPASVRFLLKLTRSLLNFFSIFSETLLTLASSNQLPCNFPTNAYFSVDYIYSHLSKLNNDRSLVTQVRTLSPVILPSIYVTLLFGLFDSDSGNQSMKLFFVFHLIGSITRFPYLPSPILGLVMLFSPSSILVCPTENNGSLSMDLHPKTLPPHLMSLNMLSSSP